MEGITMKIEEEKMIKYLNKTMKHLFKKKSWMAFDENAFMVQEHFLKAFPIKINDKNFLVIVEFNDVTTNVYIDKIEAFNKNDFNIMKNNIFPNYQEHKDRNTKSIKTFKKVREMMNEVKLLKFNSTAEAKEKIKNIFTI